MVHATYPSGYCLARGRRGKLCKASLIAWRGDAFPKAGEFCDDSCFDLCRSFQPCWRSPAGLRDLQFHVQRLPDSLDAGGAAARIAARGAELEHGRRRDLTLSREELQPHHRRKLRCVGRSYWRSTASAWSAAGAGGVVRRSALACGHRWATPADRHLLPPCCCCRRSYYCLPLRHFQWYPLRSPQASPTNCRDCH